MTTGALVSDVEVAAALRAGDEEAFASVAAELQPLLALLAAPPEVASAWRRALDSLAGYDPCVPLRAWLARALCDALPCDEGALDAPAVPPSRFLASSHPRWPGHWAAAPAEWATPPSPLVTRAALERLPARQRAALVLRDVGGWSLLDVCEALRVDDGRARALLHHARARVRDDLEEGM